MHLTVFVHRGLLAIFITAMLLASSAVRAGDITPFVGSYVGSAAVTLADGSKQPRDMSVTISKSKLGFMVEWTSTTIRPDGRRKAKSYSIEFEPSDRGEVYAAAMKRNVFGHFDQLDPMRGEPYVWSRIKDDTLSVYSLFVAEDGGYDLQQYDRTLADGGLMLVYQSVRNGEINRAVATFLQRTE